MRVLSILLSLSLGLSLLGTKYLRTNSLSGSWISRLLQYRHTRARMLRALHGGSSRGLLLHGTFVSPLPSGIQQAPTREANHVCYTQILALNNPKGFGPPAAKSTKPLPAEQQREMSKRKEQQGLSDATAAADEDDEVPQIVMDRMIKRIGVSIGIPVVLAVLMFPFFWYIKVRLGWDVPEWLPLLVSGSFFGSSALGITYGIVSTSWDPVRDGSLLGWKEAKVNWPIFFSNLQGKQGRR